jgi:hypothetical protein
VPIVGAWMLANSGGWPYAMVAPAVFFLFPFTASGGGAIAVFLDWRWQVNRARRYRGVHRDSEPGKLASTEEQN